MTTLAILRPVKPAAAGGAAGAEGGGAGAGGGEEAKENSPRSASPPSAASSAASPAGAEPKAKSRRYACPNCGRAYNAARNLARHVTLECGREPQYRCPFCAYSKHRRNELKKHIEKKHPDKQPVDLKRLVPVK